MHSSIASAFLLLFVLAFPTAFARADEINPNYSISIVGADAFQGAPGTTLADRFTVRVADRRGTPLPGIIVWFYPNCPIGVPENPPPACARGAFVGVGPNDLVKATTDAQGVAVAPPYQVGGVIDVVAGAYDWGDGTPNDVIGWPPLVTYFHINHRAGEPPDAPIVDDPAPAPDGTPAAVAAPTLSAWGAMALMILLAGIAAARGRRLER